jgi:hypothetical protein
MNDPAGACSDWEKAGTFGIATGKNYFKSECSQLKK